MSPRITKYRKVWSKEQNYFFLFVLYARHVSLLFPTIKLLHRDWFIKNCKGILPYCVCTYTIRKILLIFPKNMDLDLSKMVQHIFLAQFLPKLRANMFQTNFFKNSQNWSKLLNFLKNDCFEGLALKIFQL